MLRPLLLVAVGAFVLMCSEWVHALPADSEAKCSPLVDRSRVIECKLNGQIVDCDKPLTPGTKAVVTCKTFYTQSEELASYETSCQSDGKWSHPVHSCTPRCGESNPTIRGYHYWWYLTNKSVRDSAEEFPWHAGIYREEDGNNILICGGTIISERVIVTAAVCFWDVSSGRRRDQKVFKIAVGKIYSDWNEDEQNVQRPEIQRIIINARFRGTDENWMNDISLVKLKHPLEMTNAVRPICVDLDIRVEKSLTPGTLGTVVGWGGNQTEYYREKRRTITLPYVDIEPCERSLLPTFLSLLSNDKFCAGYLNGTSLCPRDTGGGYATQFEDGKWYLMGIVSVGVLSKDSHCNVFAYSIYTRVSFHYGFIKSVLFALH